MKKISIFLLIFFSAAAQAEVFKCTDKQGKTNYQSKPCQDSAPGKLMDIKVDPEKEAQGKAKMQMLQDEYDANKSKQQQAAPIMEPIQ